MDRPRANYDTTYCLNTKCKLECWRKVDNWTFDNGERYIFTERCEKYKE